MSQADAWGWQPPRQKEIGWETTMSVGFSSNLPLSKGNATLAVAQCRKPRRACTSEKGVCLRRQSGGRGTFPSKETCARREDS